MKTVVINALNSNSGGGKSIRDSYLKLLNEDKLFERYVVIAAKGADLHFVNNPNIEIIDMPGLFSRTLLAPIVYKFVLNWILSRTGADVVLNLGDLIVNTKAKQIYVFDWPYALDVHPKVWADMTHIEWVIRRVKLWLLTRYFHVPEIVIAQTNFIKGRIEEKYGLRDVRVINNAVTVNARVGNEKRDFGLPSGVRLVYPAVYYPHKNLEILLELGRLIKELKLDYRIVTTINPDTAGAARFLDALTDRGLQGFLANIGQVPLDQMNDLYNQCDALLMPTLLESFSIVYLEAMHHSLPVFTSNMWFAQVVCGDAAKYFDPLDAKDILFAIEEVMPNPSVKSALIEAGAQQLASFPVWEENYAKYQGFVGELLS